MSSIDTYQRYQKTLYMHQTFPSDKGRCACGCGVMLTGKRTRWASKECSQSAYIKFAILKGNVDTIRKQLFKTDKGFCRSCGVYSADWEADHIIPVHKGGGGCDISNFQTLCKECHKDKTFNRI